MITFRFDSVFPIARLSETNAAVLAFPGIVPHIMVTAKRCF